jgi:hypothetical protein
MYNLYKQKMDISTQVKYTCQIRSLKFCRVYETLYSFISVVPVHIMTAYGDEEV